MDLPVTLLTEVLTVWLDIRSLLALDSASCSTVSRKYFLDVVGSKEFCLDRAPLPSNQQNGIIEWFTLRHVKVVQLSIVCGSDFDTGTMAAFLQTCGARLQYLQIDGNKETPQVTRILEIVSLTSRALKALLLIDCGVIEARSLDALLSKCSETLLSLATDYCELSGYLLSATPLPRLQKLHMRDFSIAMGDVCKLILSSPNLRSFLCDDQQGRNDCLEALAAHCPLLQVLACQNSCSDNTAALVHLLQSCPLIEVVDFSSGDDDWNCSASNAHIAAVMQHCRNLKAFRAPGTSRNITDASILAVATRAQSLHHLCLYDCDVHSDEPILALAEHCGNLKTLELWSAKGGAYISQVALLRLICNLKNVVELNLDHCELSDPVLQAIAALCPHLQCLHVYGCTGYSDAGIAAVVLGCAALEEVIIAPSDLVFAPLGRRLWSALRPGIVFTYQQRPARVWSAMQDLGVERFVL